MVYPSFSLPSALAVMDNQFDEDKTDETPKMWECACIAPK